MKKHLFFISIIPLLFFSSCARHKPLPPPPVQEGPVVVTIYFCGTAVTSDWWGEKSKFGSPELVSTLFREQSTEPGGTPIHRKYIVDGVGTGSFIPFANLFSRAFPSSCFSSRGWQRCLKEGKSYLEKVLKETSGDVTLNLVGFSRGAVLCMWTARDFALEKRVSGINILCFDPVPGDRKVPEEIYRLGSKVKNYVGIYAEDERTNHFDPVIPHIASSGTKHWMFTVPGGHETMVGNRQKDAHHLDTYSSRMGFNNELSDELAKVSWVTKYIAVELLGSTEWGNARFNWSRQQDRETFTSNYDAMFRHKGFEYIRKISFLPNPGGLVSHRSDSNGESYCRTYRRGESDHNRNRCAYKSLAGGGGMGVGLKEVISRETGAQAWDRLRKLHGVLSPENLPQ